MVRLYIIRHADPDYETNAESGGTITNHGIEEAKALAPYLEKQGITHAFSSPLGRALDTSKYALSNLPHLQVGIEPWARELSTWRCQPNDSNNVAKNKKIPAVWDSPPATIRKELQDTASGRSKSCPGWTLVCQDHAPHAQAYREFCEASDEFLFNKLGLERHGPAYKLVTRREEEMRNARVAIFMHNGSALTWLSHLLSIPLPLVHASFWLAPSSVSTILFDEYNGPSRRQTSDGSNVLNGFHDETSKLQLLSPRMLCVGGTSHLAAAGIDTANSKYEDWERPSGVKANYW